MKDFGLKFVPNHSVNYQFGDCCMSGTVPSTVPWCRYSVITCDFFLPKHYICAAWSSDQLRWFWLICHQIWTITWLRAENPTPVIRFQFITFVSYACMSIKHPLL